MSVAALIESFEDQGLFLWEDGGRLQYVYEAGATLPDTLREHVASHRQALLRHLSATQEGVVLRGLPQAYWLGENPAFTHATPAFLHLVYTGDVPSHDVLQNALDRLVEQHPVLAYTLDGEEPLLRARPSCHPRIEVARALHKELASRCNALPEARRRLASPGSGEPLFKLAIVDDGAQRCLHAVFRLVLFDASSVHIFMRDLMRFAQAPGPWTGALPDKLLPAPTRADKRRQCEERRAAKAYWNAQLARLPRAPSLPLRRRGPAAGDDAVPPPNFTEHRQRLDAAEYTALAAKAQRQGVTVNAVLITMYLHVLARWSGEKSVCVSAMLSKRVHAGGVDDCSIGNQSDLLLLGGDGEAASFVDAVRAVQADLAAGLKHRAYDGIAVMRRWIARNDSRRSSADPPLPYVFSSLLGTPLAELPLRQSDHRMLTPQIWIDAQAYEDGAGLWLTWDELEGVFQPGVIAQAFATFVSNVTALASDANAWERGELALPAQVVQRIDTSNETATAFDSGSLFGGLLLRAADEATAQRPAAICDGRTLSFHELACKASQLAACLNENGVGPSDHVVVRGSKSLDMMIAIYGTLMAGATYIPVTRSTPALRVHAINRQAAVTTVLGDDDDDIAQVSSSPVMWSLNYARFLKELPSGYSFSLPPYPVLPTQLAYIIFTSGTTGTPKGVAVTHAAAMNTLHDCRVRFGIGPDDRLLALSELSFDLSVFDLFMPALTGCAVVLPAVASNDVERTDPGVWLDAATAAGATVWNSVPSIIDLAIAHAQAHGLKLPASLRLWMASGDWIPLALPDRLRAHLPEARFVSLGGATEAAIWSNTFEVSQVQSHWSSIPYGTPMANQRFHVLDRVGRRCPPLVTGMLHIAGDGLATGYINDPQRTAEAFFFHDTLKELLYRTGDLGRYDQDGVLELLGRADEQAKIRGFRVELSEVETVLGKHPGVSQAAAVAVNRGAAAWLLAFVVPATTPAGSPPGLPELERELSAFAAQWLNDYMLPSRWVYLPTLPYSANGKVDKRRLRELANQLVAGRAPPVGLLVPSDAGGEASSCEAEPVALRHAAIEQVVQRAAAELLCSSVRAGDNWFDLGCTSLQAVYLLHALNERLASDLRLADIYRHPSPRALVSRLVQGQSTTPNLVPLHLSPRADLPVLVLVHPVGGSVACYLPLADRLCDRFHIVALCADSDATFRTLPAMAEHYLAQLAAHLKSPHGLLFAGWSLGGVVALELARLAASSGAKRCAVATIDSFVAQSPGTDVDEADLDRVYAAELQGAAMPEGRMQERLALFKANFRALLQHRYQAPPVAAVHGIASQAIALPGLVPLASRIGGESCETLVGDHHSVMAVEALPQLVRLFERALALLEPARHDTPPPRAALRAALLDHSLSQP